MQDFRCVTDTISEIKKGLEDIQGELENALESARTVQNGVDNPNNWLGETQKTGHAFLSLVLQYHSLLTGNGSGPVVQAVEGLSEYLENDAKFYDEWNAYRQVDSM